MTALDDSDLNESLSSHESDTVACIDINTSSPLQLTSQKPIKSLKDYLHALDRHKSIDNCFLSPFNADRMYFFDEITKITNHLFDKTAQAEPHTNGGDAAEHGIQSPGHRTEHDMNIQNLDTTQTTSGAIAVESTNGDDADVQSVKTDANNNEINGCCDETKTAAKGDDADDQRRHPFSNIFKKFSSLADSGNELSNAPWPVSTKRTKFRINQMSSRDVPIFKTDRPAKLQKQNAIDACDTKMFDEQINRKSIFHDTSPSAPGKSSIVQLLESFERDRSQLFQSHFRHKTFIDRMPNGSISFDCGQLGVETRSMNTIRSLLSLHASTGQHVKQIQAKIEAQHK